MTTIGNGMMPLHVVVIIAFVVIAPLLACSLRLQSTSAFRIVLQPPLPPRWCSAGTAGFQSSVNYKKESSLSSRRRPLLLALAEKASTDTSSTSSSSSSSSASTPTTSSTLPTATTTKSSALSSPPSVDEIDWWTGIGKQFLAETQEVAACLAIVAESVLQSSSTSTAAATITTDIVALCDEIDGLKEENEHDDETTTSLASRRFQLRRWALEFQRYQLLVHLMQNDYAAYTATASFLSPSRIPRLQLPNVQDVAWNNEKENKSNDDKKNKKSTDADLAVVVAADLVADCELDDMEYQDSILDKLLLSIFRKLVAQNTGGVTSDKRGIEGLLDQGRQFMLQPNQTPEAQHEMVSKTLGGLMTPVLPPFYRVFMSGIVPNSIGTPWDGKQLGPWFYAPLLTSIVTPTFFAFLVGPSRPNRRVDGKRGGLLVEKCKFLQQSNCKGLCLHQCKLPAQQFFNDELGLPLTVTPNFVTQECQWSFGQVPLPPKEDPSFPRGCLVGCQSRQAMAAIATGPSKDLCN